MPFRRWEAEIMKTKLLAGLLFAGSALFAETHVSIGVGLGGYGYAPPPVVVYNPPPPVVAYAPPCPGPGYTWVDGYWYQAGPRRLWRQGYWAPPAYGRAYKVMPRYDEGRQSYGRYEREHDGRYFSHENHEDARGYYSRYDHEHDRR